MSATAGPSPDGPRAALAGVDPQDIIDIIERVEQVDDPIHSAGLTTEDMTLPGFGDPYDDCGDPRMHFCENCARHFPVGRTCSRNVCERCAQSWCREQSTEIASRIESLRRKRQAERDEHQRFHHIVFSPPWADWKPLAEDEWERTMRVVRDILVEVFGMNGVSFLHSWSGHVEEGGDDIGEWQNRLFSGRDFEDVKAELMLRPHIHVIAVGHEVPGEGVTDVVNEETGWIIHRITKGNTNVSMFGLEDLARVTTYNLSHTSIRKLEERNSAQYRYWGQELNNIHVFEDVRRLVDAKVRAIAPRTLDIPYQEVACVADNQVNDEAHDYVQRVNLAANADDQPDPATALEADRDDVPGGGPRVAPMGTSSPDGWDLTPWAADRDDVDDFYLAEGIPSASKTMTSTTPAPTGSPARNRPPDEAPGPRPEREPCRGRILMGTRAPEYLNDPDWRAQAPYADELREAYDKAREEDEFFPDPDEDVFEDTGPPD